MDFAPLELPGLDECNDCGAAFEHMDETQVENRCPRCQSVFRIAEAQRMHDQGIHNFVFNYITGSYEYVPPFRH